MRGVFVSVWAIYASPLDFEGKFVARRFVVTNRGVVPTPDIHVGDTLAEVREALPPGLTNVGRSLTDQVHIAESWL